MFPARGDEAGAVRTQHHSRNPAIVGNTGELASVAPPPTATIRASPFSTRPLQLKRHSVRAKKAHPDGSGSEAAFRELQGAYEAILDVFVWSLLSWRNCTDFHRAFRYRMRRL